MSNYCKLGVNIDHVATIRNARGGDHPDVLKAAKIVEMSTADSITMHLREDRRHIIDKDIFTIKKNVNIPINLEIAPTIEMVNIAIKLKPHSVCFVPEKREEVTTEGGLDIKKNYNNLRKILQKMSNSSIKIACFIDPDYDQIKLLKELKIDNIEFHTGKYALAKDNETINYYLNELKKAIEYANNLGFNCHAGHGLNFKNVGNIASIPQIQELNIGHFLIGESVFSGLEKTILQMKKIIEVSRK